MKKNISKINMDLKRSIFFSILFLALWLVQTSCKKLIEVDAPTTSINSGNVYLNDATATAVLTGIYTKISNSYVYNLTSYSPTSSSLYLSLSADELTLYNQNDAILSSYYRNDLSATTSSFLWNSAYDLIFITNNAIEGLEKSTSLTPSVKQQLLGEAKFMRAFCYFYLVNVYGDVPLAILNDWQKNAGLARSSINDVYQQIIKDLKESQDQLNGNFVNSSLVSTSERSRPNKWAATALLARTYLYTRNWVKAEEEATSIINNNTLFDTVALNKVFLKNSKEAIWQLQPVRAGSQSNTGDGAIFILPSTGPNTSDYPVYLSTNIVNSFESGDLRKGNWVDSVKPSTVSYYYPKKYKIGKINTSTQEYMMVLRLAEQYLIRSEARVQQNNISGGQFDLNTVRMRAGLQSTTASDKNSLLTAISQERRVELFTEFGHRWMDLKRTNTIDAVMTIISSQKGGTWNSYKALFPIPQSEITLDPHLTQNPGY